jgi:hypothetical protein
MCYMDVDLSTDLSMITPLLAGVCEEGYAIAYGSRLAKGANIERSFKREINSRGYVLLFKLLFRAKFSDAQCGFKAITREAAQALLPLVQDGEWFFDTELLILAQQRGYKMKEVPVKWVEDPDTRVKFPDDIIKMVSKLVRLRFRAKYGASRGAGAAYRWISPASLRSRPRRAHHSARRASAVPPQSCVSRRCSPPARL